jgi:hypothetical protein
MAALLLAPAPGAAQEVDIGPFRRCAASTAPLERLACFDEALRAAEGGVASATSRRDQSFGLSSQQAERKPQSTRPADPVTSPAGAQEDVAAISGTIASVSPDENGRNLFRLENGQLWRQTSNSSFRGDLRAGDVVLIRKGSVAGYRLTVPGRAGFIGVRRVR